MEVLLYLADQFEAISNLGLSIALLRYLWGYRWVKISLSCGEFKIRAKDIDLPNLTAIVSKVYFGGGWLPDQIRHELINLTNPNTKDIVRFEFNNNGGTPPPQK